MKQIITVAILIVTAIAVVESQQPKPKPITWKQDKDVSGSPLIVPVQDLPEIVVPDVSGCECNCDGKCMEQIAELRAELEALKVECANCGCGPKPLQSSIGGKSVTIRGQVYDYDSFITKYRGTGPQIQVAGMSVESHLADHGVERYSPLTTFEKFELHTAVHNAGFEADGNFVIRQTSPKVQTNTTRRSCPTYSSGGCANGQCSRPSTRRFRLFR